MPPRTSLRRYIYDKFDAEERELLKQILRGATLPATVSQEAAILWWSRLADLLPAVWRGTSVVRHFLSTTVKDRTGDSMHEITLEDLLEARDRTLRHDECKKAFCTFAGFPKFKVLAAEQLEEDRKKRKRDGWTTDDDDDDDDGDDDDDSEAGEELSPAQTVIEGFRDSGQVERYNHVTGNLDAAMEEKSRDLYSQQQSSPAFHKSTPQLKSRSAKYAPVTPTVQRVPCKTAPRGFIELPVGANDSSPTSLLVEPVWDNIEEYEPDDDEI